MKIKQFALILLPALLLSACDTKSAPEEIKQKTGNFYEALLMEDEKEIMSYFTKDSPSYYDYYEQFSYNIEYFNFNYKIEGIDIEKQNRKTYNVKAIVKVDGVDEKDKEYSYESLENLQWVKKDGQWKLYEYENEYMK